MTVKSAPYYWLVCDEPGCDAKSTDETDYAAYASAGYAADEAREGDWSVSLSMDGKDYCDEHARYVCAEKGCEAVITREQLHEQDELCDAHWQASEAGRG